MTVAVLLAFGADDALAQSGVVVHGNVFGGGNAAEVTGNTTVLMQGTTPTVETDVYGGGALAAVGTGDGTHTTTVTILGGTVERDVYGGGLGDGTHSPDVNGVVQVNIGTNVNGTISGSATILGNIFGCNNAAGSPKDSVKIDIWRTAHTTGTAPNNNEVPTYSTMADLQTDITTREEGSYADACKRFALQAVYGGGNEADYVPASTGKGVRVWVHNCENTVKMVYGGGRAAAVGSTGSGAISADAKVIVDGGLIDTLFAGGDGHTLQDPSQPWNATTNDYRPANIYGNATAHIRGGYYTAAFAGSNTSGTITGSKSLAIDNDGPCATTQEELIGTLFGGANAAELSGEVSLTVACGAGEFEEVYGGSNKADITGNVTLTINGGTFNRVFGGSKGTVETPANIKAGTGDNKGNVTLNLYGGTIKDAAFGGSNINGSIEGNITVNVEDKGTSCPLDVQDIFGAGNLAKYTAPTGAGARTNNPIVYINHLRDSKPVRNVYGAGNGDPDSASQAPGMVTGNPKVIIGDGENSHYARISGNVYGGGNAAKVTGTTTVLMQNANSTVAQNIFGGGNLANVSGATDIDLNAGTVSLDVYGGGALANTGGSNVTLAGGTVTQDIYGGGLGRMASGTQGNPGYVSPVEAQVTGAVQVNINSGSVRDVFGCNNFSGAPQGSVQVNINSNVGGNVFGGGNQAAYTGTPDVNIIDGTVSGSVFGGGNEAGVGGGDVAMTGGTVSTAIYGGCNTSGTVTNGTTVNMSGGTAGYLYGGGYGAGTTVNKGTAAQGSSVTLNGTSATVVHDVYGGGNAGTVNGGTKVDIKAGTVTSDVYGGGYQAPVGGATLVNIGSVGDGDNNNVVIGGYVFGANNVSGTPSGISEVHVYSIKNPTSGTYALAGVYGGGNRANYTGTKTLVEVHNCFNEIENVFGGGNAASATTTDVTIHGGTIDNVFGGGDGHLLTNPNLAWNATDNPYLAAPITGNTKVLINGGQINNVFGGNNTSGNIAGTIDVTVEWTNTACGGINNTLGYVYGGGKDASYTPSSASAASPQVKIYNGTVTHDVYGGGKGSDATVTAVPTVTVGDLTSGHGSYAAIVNGAVYGGGQLAPVVGSTSVTIQKSNTQVDGVFGGGSEAGVSSNTNISMTGGTVNGGTIDASAVRCGIYGGCNTTGTVGGNAIISVTGGTIGTSKSVYANIHGGGYGQPTAVSGDVEITLGTNSAGPSLFGNVYGGSALGNVNTNNTDNHTYVTLTKGTIDGNLFGGGLGDNTNAALVKGNVTVSVAGGSVTGGVFGCNDQNGTPQGSVVVNITGSNNTANAIANVYGGGNVAHYNPTTPTNGYPQVTVSGCDTKVGNVYGGGNAAAVPQTSVTINGGTIANVFGGGMGQDAPAHVGYLINTNDTATHSYGNGTVTVAIHAGQIGNVYGGNNAGGTVRDKVTVTADWSGSAACKSLGYVYGGGYGADTRTNGDVEVEISGATVTNDVYGGSALGQVNNEATDKTTVNILSGTVNGNVYGGGLGLANVLDVSGNITTNNSAKGQVNGEVTVNIGSISGSTLSGSATINGMVFGGNNTNGSPQADIYVNVYQTDHTTENTYPANPAEAAPNTSVLDGDDVTYIIFGGGSTVNDDRFALKAVYGGGNLARYTTDMVGASTHVTVFGCANTIKYVYGGGKAADTKANSVLINGGLIYQVYGGGDGSAADTKADVDGDATVTIDGGLIDGVFGGSNTRGEVHGTASVTFDEDNNCDMIVITTFGGGNQAPGQGNIVVTIPCGTKGLTDVYGCSNEADFTGNVTLNILGGEMERAFGGSRMANIKGNVTVNAFAGDINELFGGNNAGGYIFGDNLTEGNITVNVDLNNNMCPGEKKINFVYGGGNDAAYKPDVTGYTTPAGAYDFTSATFTTETNRISPVVNIISGYQTSGASPVWRCVDTAVFGGGKGSAAVIMANPKVTIGADRMMEYVDGEVKDLAPIIPNLPVVIGTGKNALKRTLMGDVFGGGNAAEVDGNTKVIVKGSRTKIWNNVYGGGNAAIVKGNTDIEVGSAIALSAPKITYNETTHLATVSSYGDFDFDTPAPIYYTLDGSVPDPASASPSGPTYLYTEPVAIANNQNIKALRYYNGNGLELTSLYSSYPVQPLRLPTITADGNEYVITSPTAGVELFYTLDGSRPDPEHFSGSGPTFKYTAPITGLTSCQTLKAVAHTDTPHRVSNIASVTIPVAMPTINIDGSNQVTLATETTGDDVFIYYTTDGSQPDLAHVDITPGHTDAGFPTKRYTTPFTLPTTSTTVLAVAAKTGCPTSAMKDTSIALPAPTIEVTDVTVNAETRKQVTLSIPIEEASIYYTTGTGADENNPIDPNPAAVGSSTPTKYYNGQPFLLPVDHTTIKAKAIMTGLTPSSVAIRTVE